MEKRLLLAIALSFLVLILFQVVFVKSPVEAPLQEPEAAERRETAPLEVQAKPETAPPLPVSPDSTPVSPTSAQEEKSLIVETSLYRAKWTNHGAVLKSWKLEKHLDEDNEPLELVNRSAEDHDIFPFQLQSGDQAFDNMANHALYEFSVPRLELSGGRSGEIRFTYSDEQGNRIVKILTFTDGSYEVGIRLEARKQGTKIDPGIIWGPSFGSLAPVSQRSRFGGVKGVAVLTAQKVTHHDEKKFDIEKSISNFAEWAAYEDNYYTALFLLPPQERNAVFHAVEQENGSIYLLSVLSPQSVYIGPKEFDTLKAFHPGTEKVINFGFFGLIAEFLYKGMKAIHDVFPNWGFSIILLTIGIKILFFPLTFSSTKSMAKMQQLQPKLKALKAKYKKSKQDPEQRRKMNEEMMALYKKEGINPAGGCLPILIQLPIFWGFFRLLVVAVEFRHSPFIFWITDLSLKDPFYVTPILMGLTQFISQKMTPTTADSSQQKMMLIMPVVMTIFFLNFQSGLVLYWLTNNVLQIGQQYLMNRIIHKKKSEIHGKKRKK